MKFGTIREASSSEVEASLAKTNPTTHIFDVDNKIVYGSIVGITILLVVLGSFLHITLPNNKELLEQYQQYQQIQLLNFALRSEDTLTRNQTVKLLIEANIIDDPERKIQKMIASDSLPDWHFMDNLSLPVPMQIDGKVVFPNTGISTITGN